MNGYCALAVSVALGSATLYGQKMTDDQFVNQAAQINMTEAHLGKMAQQNGMSQDIKNYGVRIETDHKSAYQKLTSLAATASVPQSIDASHQKMIDRLGRLSGQQFDQQFKQAMIDDHQKAINLFEKASNELQNQQLKGYADQILPILREHLQVARNVGTGNSGSILSSNQTTSSVDNQATNVAATGNGASDQTRMMPGDKSGVHYGTVTQYEEGKMLVLKVRDRQGRHVYNLAEDNIAGSPPSDLKVGSRVQVTEITDANGRRSIRVENDTTSGNVRSRTR